MSYQIPRMNKVLKRIWMLLAVLIIFMAVLSSIFRSLTPWAKEYKGEIEHHLSLLIGQPVTIQTMETGWYWFQPVLRLNQVTLGDDDKKNFRISKLLVGINLFKSFLKWQIQPGVLYIDDMHLNLREKDGHWTINGITTNALSNKEMIPEKTKQILLWLSQQEHLIIKHVSAYFYYSNGGVIPINGLNLSVANSGGHYKFKGEARLEQTSSTDFQLLGDGYFNPNQPNDIEGQFYFSAKNMIPAQWEILFPMKIGHLEGGKGNVALWVDVHHGSISLVQAQIELKRLAWRLSENQHQLMQTFFANLSWKPYKEGWELNVDQIQLRMGDIKWPENKLSLQYNRNQESYRLFIKSILIDSLLSHVGNWPKNIQFLSEIKPEGILRDTQVLITANSSSIPPIPFFGTQNQAQQTYVSPHTEENINFKLSVNNYSINYILTRFEQLGWDAKNNIPQVKNLSGVVHWQPEQGRLELDSEDISLKVNGYPMQSLALLNGALDWKELNDGLRVSIERFILNHPELTLTMQGAVDQLTRQSVGHMRLGMEFSAKNLQKWTPFLPQKYLKPKLYLWLKNDIKRIAEASGRVALNGLAKDFPFDNHAGEFTIESFASGCEVAINSKWQVVKEIDGYIHLKNRNLNIDIVHANFQGVVPKYINLRIDDIGKDRENLIASAEVNASVQKMVNYIMNSPLQKKLSLLKILSIKGLALLRFNVEVPLYPQKDDVLAQGNIIFNNNTIKLNHNAEKLAVEDLNGKLFFNESGIKASVLYGNIFGNLMNIKIESSNTPQSATTIAMRGKWTADSLKKRFTSPLLAVIDGSFWVNVLLKIANKSSVTDSINLNSSLEGLAINLPAPLGKKADTKAPLELQFKLNQLESLRVRGHYDNRLSADFLFKIDTEGFAFNSGQIRLGDAYAVSQKLPGLSIEGKLKELDLKELKKVYAQFFSSKKEASLWDKLRTINLTLDKFRFMRQQFDAMVVKAKILPNKDWAFNLQQKNIAADLTYHLPTNELSGYVHNLHLDKMDNIEDNSSESLIHPNQIPNLNLRIDNFSVNQIQIGDVTLKSKSTANKLIINYCQINTPVYQLNAQGEWLQQQNVNKTKLNIKLNINHLEKALERWNVTPVVHAKKGYFEFHGSWKDSLYRFSLSSLNGTVFLQLKNGRITHLSKETEEKLDLGKLLSILSLQTIPRRLQLDFSDLAYQGYSFDIFQGNFNVNNGILKTQDSYLDGPVAYADMKGELDLLKRTYNLNLQIAPHITASLPIVATIAGGPIAGVAVWVANKIITQSMQKISSYSYKVSGPWNDPIIQQLSIVKQNMIKPQSSKIKKNH